MEAAISCQEEFYEQGYSSVLGGWILRIMYEIGYAWQRFLKAAALVWACYQSDVPLTVINTFSFP